MKIHNYSILLFSICFFLVIKAQNSEKKYKGPPPPKVELKGISHYESVVNDPLNARIYTLNNGLKVYLSVYKDAPRIQTYIAVKAGSKNDPSNSTGLAHYLEHMVFKGTDVYGTKDFKKENIEIKKLNSYTNYIETFLTKINVKLFTTKLIVLVEKRPNTQLLTNMTKC